MMEPTTLYELDLLPRSPKEGQRAILIRSELLCQLTLEILDQSIKPVIPTLGQLMIKREMLLETLRRLLDAKNHILEHLSPETATLLHQQLNQCQKLDETIQQNLEHVCLNMKSGLTTIRNSKNVLNQYRSDQQDSLHSRSLQG